MSPPANDRVPKIGLSAHLGGFARRWPAFVAKGRNRPAQPRRRGDGAADRWPRSPTSTSRSSTSMLSTRWASPRRRPSPCRRPDPGLRRGAHPGPGFRRAARRDLRAGRRSGPSATSPWRSSGHLHALSLRFHLERQTGGLSRVIERGTSGMEFLIRFTTFNILPTLFEIVLVGGILWSLYDWRFTAVTLARHRRLRRLLGRAVGVAHQVRARA